MYSISTGVRTHNFKTGEGIKRFINKWNEKVADKLNYQDIKVDTWMLANETYQKSKDY